MISRRQRRRRTDHAEPIVRAANDVGASIAPQHLFLSPLATPEIGPHHPRHRGTRVPDFVYASCPIGYLLVVNPGGRLVSRVTPSWSGTVQGSCRRKQTTAGGARHTAGRSGSVDRRRSQARRTCYRRGARGSPARRRHAFQPEPSRSRTNANRAFVPDRDLPRVERYEGHGPTGRRTFLRHRHVADAARDTRVRIGTGSLAQRYRRRAAPRPDAGIGRAKTGTLPEEPEMRVPAPPRKIVAVHGDALVIATSLPYKVHSKRVGGGGRHGTQPSDRSTGVRGTAGRVWPVAVPMVGRRAGGRGGERTAGAGGCSPPDRSGRPRVAAVRRGGGP